MSPVGQLQNNQENLVDADCLEKDVEWMTSCCDLEFDLGVHMGVPWVDPFSASSMLPENYIFVLVV